ncbi:MAG TPA: DinB family protein [Alphaproteobacteria bacterium]|nr:DinB family protein [Alphaproteobacteria bacterium]
MRKTRFERPSEGEMNRNVLAATLQELSAMPGHLETAANSVRASQWTTRDENGGFSFVEHACHLRDIDADGFSVRIERMLSETNPALPDIDGAKLAAERDYLAQDFKAALIGFANARVEIVRRLAALTPADRSRVGTLEGVGELSIDGLVLKILEHDGEHRRDFEALRDQLSGGRL